MADENARPIGFEFLNEAPKASDRALRYRDCEKAGSSEYLCFAFWKPISRSFGRVAPGGPPEGETR